MVFERFCKEAAGNLEALREGNCFLWDEFQTMYLLNPRWDLFR
jgi:hypothetical protein